MAEWRRALPRAVIFDLDGTLVDSVPDISVALNRALADLDYPVVSEENVRCWVGNGARVLCGRAISRSNGARADHEDTDRLLECFLARYAERTCKGSRVYPGVNESLNWLRDRGIPLAVVTNKPLRHTRMLLENIGLAPFFSVVLGGDSVSRKKPDPEPLVACLQQLRLGVSDALMIGDSENDIAAARAAGIDSICVTYGYNQGRDVHAIGANLVLDSLANLSHYLDPH